MKFTCNQQTLAKALNTVSKAVSNRTTLPILERRSFCRQDRRGYSDADSF